MISYQPRILLQMEDIRLSKEETRSNERIWSHTSLFPFQYIKSNTPYVRDNKHAQYMFYDLEIKYDIFWFKTRIHETITHRTIYFFLRCMSSTYVYHILFWGGICASDSKGSFVSFTCKEHIQNVWSCWICAHVTSMLKFL